MNVFLFFFLFLSSVVLFEWNRATTFFCVPRGDHVSAWNCLLAFARTIQRALGDQNNGQKKKNSLAE